jgi:hypothetical protein
MHSLNLVKVPPNSNKPNMSVQQKEQLCVFLARAHSRHIILLNLASLDAESKRFNFSGLTQIRLNWRPNFKGKLLQILCLPLYLLFLIGYLIWVPVRYLKQRDELQKKYRELTNKLIELETDKNIQYPTEKTLNQLWSLHGFKHIGDEELPLLDEWLDILFGLGTAARIDFMARQLKVAKGHNFVNEAYYRGEAGAAHFSFPSSSRTAIGIVSNELSYYDRAEN